MALSIQIPYRGDQYLFQGISQGAQGIGQGIEQMTANLKKAKAYRAMAVDALGMEPEAVDKMGLPELEGHFQAVAVKNAMAQSQALAQERMMKAAELKSRMDEAEAWPKFAQELQAGAAPMPGTPGGMGGPDGPPAPGAEAQDMFSRENIVRAMGRMGATSPRLAASLSRTLIPQMMQPDGGDEPRFRMSPEGNPYVIYRHTILPDRAQLELSENGGTVPPGYTRVEVSPGKYQLIKTGKELPQTFHSSLDEIHGKLAKNQELLNQPDSSFVDALNKPIKPAEIKAERERAKEAMAVARRRGQAIVDRYHSTGYLTDDQRGQLYDQLGLTPPAKPAAPAAPAPAGATAVDEETANRLIKEANEAIAKGADKKKIAARLKEKYNLDVK